ncbi:hypothetical protein OG783_00300 [Streptomyces jietaisiensis]|uniref:hypothetical protein n=1 Tax=Streptomyces griseoaurantiacus TaxID=68213 RepID=UPI003249BCE5
MRKEHTHGSAEEVPALLRTLRAPDTGERRPTWLRQPRSSRSALVYERNNSPLRRQLGSG